MILAISAIVAINLSAQEAKAEKAECKKEKKECKLTPEQRIEQDIKVLSEELYLSEEGKFAKELNERQVKAVLRYHGPKHKGELMKKGEGPKHKGELKGEGPKHKEKKEQQQ